MDIKRLKSKIVWKIRFIKIKIKNYRIKTNKIFLVGTPLHGNLGDHAIAKETIRMIEESISSKVIEIPSPTIGKNTEKFKKIIKDAHIVITGGGFMGSLWENEEKMVQAVVENFPNNKVIFFPQTLFFENTKKGEEIKQNYKQIYNKDNLYFVAREEKTYEIAKDIFKHVILVPDIVLRMDVKDKNEKREGCLICMRKDKEKVIKKEQMDEIKSKLNLIYKKIDTTDTVINERINPEIRDSKLSNKINEFQKYELVITDRLHGMIFATVSKTPCIVFNNSSSKVKGVYKYINKYCNYVFMCEEINQISSAIDKINNLKNREFDKKALEEEYRELKQIIEGGKVNG